MEKNLSQPDLKNYVQFKAYSLKRSKSLRLSIYRIVVLPFVHKKLKKISTIKNCNIMHWHALYFPVFLFHNKVSKKNQYLPILHL
jgi:hypothetical protein